VAVVAVEEVPPVDRKLCKRGDKKNGQAMVEFLLGLVGIIFLLIGLLQVRELSWNSSQMNLDMRGLLADRMIEQTGVTSGGQMVYSQGHDEGNDERKYTDDDIMLSTSPYTFVDSFLAYVGYSEDSTFDGTRMKEYLKNYKLDDPYKALDETPSDISDTFDMIYQDAYVEVMVLPYMQQLTGKRAIELQGGIWMPELGGLMEE